MRIALIAIGRVEKEILTVLQAGIEVYILSCAPFIPRHGSCPPFEGVHQA